MARENKRNRDERRFGKPERLADKFGSIPFGMPEDFTNAKALPKEELDSWKYHVECKADEAKRSALVVADNVSRYFADCYGAKDFHWVNDLPSVMPPFPSMFIESGWPSGGLPNYEFATPPKRWGLLIHLMDRNGDPVEGSTAGFSCKPLEELPTGTEYLLSASLFEETSTGFIDAGRIGVGMFIDGSGKILGNPGFVLAMGEHLSSYGRARDFASAKILAAPLFLSLAFMNCKNVRLQEHASDKTLNRDREKAGFKPFLRYHTINIEPMKTVLSTEGGIEANGLKKSLHICRGHFATYGPDKPLFGHFTGTVWKSSHVRGSAKQGVIVSDYNVNPPKP